MTLAEQLTEYKELKGFILTGLKENIQAGGLLGYTSNGTKVTYEGQTKSNELLKEYNYEISQLQSLINHNVRLC